MFFFFFNKCNRIFLSRIGLFCSHIRTCIWNINLRCAIFLWIMFLLCLKEKGHIEYRCPELILIIIIVSATLQLHVCRPQQRTVRELFWNHVIEIFGTNRHWEIKTQNYQFTVYRVMDLKTLYFVYEHIYFYV